MCCVGCSRDDLIGGGQIDHTSYPPVTTEPPSLLSASPELPPDFPRDIPVVKGSYAIERGQSAGSTTLVVRDVGRAAKETAGRLLTDAGYDHQVMLGMDVYISPKYVVTLSADDTGGGLVLRYLVTTLADVPGIPKIPPLTLPTFAADMHPVRTGEGTA